jgi:WW domain-binding protein 4
LGLVEEDEAVPSTFEIEQMVRNRDTKIGQWEEVTNEPSGLYSGNGNGIKTEHGADEEEETEGWKFQHKGKRPIRDPYDDDDFDPSAILKMRKKVKQDGEQPVPVEIPTAEELASREGALDREKWSGRIELNPAPGTGTSPTKKDGLVYQKGGGWVKVEEGGDQGREEEQDTKPGEEQLGNQEAEGGVQKPAADVKPVLPGLALEAGSQGLDSTASGEAAGGLFKKRRPPPSSRKK